MNESETITADAELASTIRDSRLLRLYHYWRTKKGDRRFPTRKDIEVLDLSYVLGHLMLLDVIRDPLRFRVRVHGTDMALRAGYELTGKYLDELPITDYRRYVRARCEGLVARGEPLLVHHDRMLDGHLRRYEALWLPLSDDGQQVTALVCALIYDRDPS